VELNTIQFLFQIQFGTSWNCHGGQLRQGLLPGIPRCQFVFFNLFIPVIVNLTYMLEDLPSMSFAQISQKLSFQGSPVNSLYIERETIKLYEYFRIYSIGQAGFFDGSFVFLLQILVEFFNI
jgi:hypothetical protein